MPKTERGPLGPDFDARLRRELDRFGPPDSSPRYANAAPPVRAWPLAPAALLVALAAIAGLTVWAASGSANPQVWTNRVETVINPPSPRPGGESNSSPAPQPSAPAPKAAPVARPSGRPGASASPDPRESPELDDNHSWTPGGAPSPSPSPLASPTDH
jgi:hypothetical protein